MRSPTAVLRERFGFPAFRAGQETLVRAVLQGRDAVGILPTGGGKSLCYQVPALMLPGLTLVVSPLISLMEDQAGRARAAGLPAHVLHSGLSPSARAEVLQDAAAGRVRVLLVAPERFGSEGFRSSLTHMPVSFLTIDEAHCISSWGHDFRPAYRELGAARGLLPGPVPVLALTATATPRVRKDIETVLRLRDPVRVIQSFDRPNLWWEVRRFGSQREKLSALAREVWTSRASNTDPGAILVYAATRKGVEGIRDRLARMGLPAERYHAGLPPDHRTRIQEAFLTGPGPVVAATNAFGMGIDRSDVRLVIHAEVPRSLEDFYQEAGRGGRDGQPARSLALDAPGDDLLRRRFLESGAPASRGLAWRVLPRFRTARDRRRGEEGRLRAAESYLRTRGCRRAHLLAYFGEESTPGPCYRCDRCIRRDGPSGSGM